MEFDARPYWKPGDLAKLLDVSRAQIYRLIKDETLPHVKVGERTVRVPSWGVSGFLGEDSAGWDGPRAEPEDIEARIERFTERTGHAPDEFAELWRSDEIEDTPEHTRDAIEALALREHMAVEA